MSIDIQEKLHVEDELREAVERILQSKSRRKLVVAGPGAGKTTLFRQLLEAAPGGVDSRLVLTFINNLKNDLQRTLGDLARVNTLHGYCQSLLRTHPELRSGITGNFICLPGLASLIKTDWEYIWGNPVPHFVTLMRNLTDDDAIDFYLERANFYDAVDFDDSVFRTCRSLKENPNAVQGLDLILIDEYQDFNRMEATFIEQLAQQNPIVVAGDDDQALYSELRGASWEHIRSLHNGELYEKFTLPFCMRCPEVIVNAISDILARARENGFLRGRIDKPYRHYSPKKGADSLLYPYIVKVTTTVQRNNANYFGRYIAAAIGSIPANEIQESRQNFEPTVLIIGSRQYRQPVEEYLIERGYHVGMGSKESGDLTRDKGLGLLKDTPESNLGWRLILNFETAERERTLIRAAKEKSVNLIEVIPADLRDAVLTEADTWEHPEVPNEEVMVNEGAPIIKLTTYEGAKGLSAQHVFILGIHDGDMPQNPDHIQDIEICRFVVGLTRTKKRCTLMLTRRFAADRKTPSRFLSWIAPERYEPIAVDAAYLVERDW
jgi:ATP-dependent DNA helicase UvrD/PcrA